MVGIARVGGNRASLAVYMPANGHGAFFPGRPDKIGEQTCLQMFCIRNHSESYF
jgi:hypothetical protein